MKSVEFQTIFVDSDADTLRGEIENLRNDVKEEVEARAQLEIEKRELEEKAAELKGQLNEVESIFHRRSSGGGVSSFNGRTMTMEQRAQSS